MDLERQATGDSRPSTSRPAREHRASDPSKPSATSQRDKRQSAAGNSDASKERRGTLGRAFTSVQAAVRMAHAQDFERKRRPSAAAIGSGRAEQQGTNRAPEDLDEEMKFGGGPEGSSDEEEEEIEKAKRNKDRGDRAAEDEEVEELRRLRSGGGKRRET